MNRSVISIILLSIFLVTSCNRSKHFISDKGYRKKVEVQFEKQKDLAKNRAEQLFTVFDQDLSLEEKEALQFLFAYMPLSDLADYDGDFYLKNVRASFAARDTFSWGKQIPEEIFRHFVLPVRVNNENLDSARWVFFMELKDRIKRLSMKEAVLEVNHWCHEKVTYHGSDGRTSSPLASVKTALGRCGEESTFTVAALRAAGIPARQCYTPRWAHSDDNHAWVEVWVEGKWHYLGACEPEPDLDLAWFTGPAKRAMLVNTNVFGDYEGPEDVLVKDPRFTRINILSNYTGTKRIFVRVVDSGNKPVDSASVEFQLYNYAEFYSLTRSFTDQKGICSFLTGLGDLLIWASKDDRFGYQKVTVSEQDTVTIELSRKTGQEYTVSFDLVPPAEQKTETKVSDSLRKVNDERFAFEDKMRADYEQTFIDSAKTFRLAINLKCNPDTLWTILKKSRGNWREITGFMSSVPEEPNQEERRPWVFPLLLAISEKDLRDVSIEVLSDNIIRTWTWEPLSIDRKIISDFLLSPRVDNEFLKPYKAFFQEKFDQAFIKEGRKDPKKIINWVLTYIQTDNTANYGRAPITPKGVYELRVSDSHSRDILFVALCRSFGIPARLESATKTPQYFKEKWVDVRFENKDENISARGTVILLNDRRNERKPEYYTHFTIEKFTDGYYRSLDYETDPVMQHFPAKIEIVPGSYLLVTGNRLTNSTVLTKLDFFTLEADKVRNINIELRKNLIPPAVLGKGLEIKKLFRPGDHQANLISIKNGVVIGWIEPDKEPSRHFTADLIGKREEFSKRDFTILLLFRNNNELESFLKKNSKELPGKVIIAIASTGSLKELSAVTGSTMGRDLPVIIFINSKDEISYLSSGYKIGVGDDLLKLKK